MYQQRQFVYCLHIHITNPLGERHLTFIRSL